MAQNNEYTANLAINMHKNADEFARADNIKSKLISKVITENGEYEASADNVNGFSDINVEISGGPEFSSVIVTGIPKQLNSDLGVPNYSENMTDPSNILIMRSETGAYELPDVSHSYHPALKTTVYAICVDPLVSITGFNDYVYDQYVVFTPDIAYDGFYDFDNRKISMDGDTVVPVLGIEIRGTDTMYYRKGWQKHTPPTIDKENEQTWLQIWNSFQGGIYNYSFYYPELLSGTIYLRCFEVSKNEELSARRLKEATSVDFHGQNKFGKIVDMQRFTIYEGDWGEYYAVRVEVWYHDPVKKEERMLMSKIYRMEGWMR